ncbi:MAG: undecaprenyldiphospho-muramoylpentapeptide beta-N-acetylglucosaminyltransferase [Chloroflexi bacterium]|nr:undecaprenyldiphospho-muramoylpentapeptide beta-N-acetylglucosaminyltransferase [Chloroflexota bacterium]
MGNPKEERTVGSVRIWIAGGGTGGHVYPGLAVVQALAAKSGADVQFVYVGGEGGVEEQLAEHAGLRFVGVSAGGVHGLAPRRVVQNLIKLTRGWWSAYRLGRQERPAAMFATGGYASVPVALAAWALRVPILVYLPDIEPGLAVRAIARLAKQVAVTVDDSCAHFLARKVVVTGYPVRAEFQGLDRAEARAALGLSPENVLLVMGGSTGARSINQALSGSLEQVLELTQVVHVSGKLDWPWVEEQRESLPLALQARYHAFSYLHDMGAALAAADLTVCRAGASTLGELPFFGLPAVLVPYPHAWRYQRINAEWLASRGAAEQVDDAQLPVELLPTVRRLLGDRAVLQSMSDRMQALTRPDAAAQLADKLLALAIPERGR